jgi:hypothetical protein
MVWYISESRSETFMRFAAIHDFPLSSEVEALYRGIHFVKAAVGRPVLERAPEAHSPFTKSTILTPSVFANISTFEWSFMCPHSATTRARHELRGLRSRKKK